CARRAARAFCVDRLALVRPDRNQHHDGDWNAFFAHARRSGRRRTTSWRAVMSAIVIGVDGGGSRTRVLVADEQGKEIVSVEGEGSAVRPGEAERSADINAALVRDALASSDMN